MPDTSMLHFPTFKRATPARDAKVLLDTLMSVSLADWVAAAKAQSLGSDVHARARGRRPPMPDRLAPRLRQWWTTNARLVASRTIGENTSEEEMALARVLGSPELSYQAWLIRDQVETACCRFDSVDGRRACPRARLRDVRRATERAALALLARPALSPDVFRALYGDFERVLPIGDLRPQR